MSITNQLGPASPLSNDPVQPGVDLTPLPAMSERPTPRTNKERFTLSAYRGWLVHAEFAEELEQENQELRDQLAERDAQLAETKTAFREIVRDFNFCADESPNSFCSRACADVAKQALARIDANAGAEVPR